MSKIRFLIMDVDGTLTDGKIYMGNQGELMKAFNIKDGAGIHDILIPHGITPIIITGRKSDIVNQRCLELGITDLYQGISDKVSKLKEILNENQCGLESAAYIGDDINDLQSMWIIKQSGGVIGCPADAIDEIKTISDFTSSKNGGEGAVRDFIEYIMKYNKDDNV